MVRAAFGNNNVDTCARVCHSPTGYGLKQTFGTSAGTQDFASVDEADVIVVIGANPTDGHPVFASRMKRRLRAGRPAHRRRPAPDRPGAHARTSRPTTTCQLLPGTNVAVVNAMAHVVVTEGLLDRGVRRRALRGRSTSCAGVHRRAGEQARGDARRSPASRPPSCAPPPGSTPPGRNAAIYYGLGVTEHSQGSTMVMGMANLAMATGNIGREGVGVNPLRGQNNVQGSCDMGSFPHELPGLPARVATTPCARSSRQLWGATIEAEPGLRIPNMFDAAIDGTFRALFVQGEDIAQSDPNTQHVEAALRAMDLVVVQDLFLNETAKFAHVFLPGTSFLEKDGTFTNAERRINRVRPVMAPQAGKHEWQVACEIATAMGYPMHYADAVADHGRDRRHHADLRRGLVRAPRRGRLDAVAVQRRRPARHADHARRRRSCAARASFVETRLRADDERTTRKFPLILTTGRILSQYNVGAQTRRTAEHRRGTPRTSSRSTRTTPRCAASRRRPGRAVAAGSGTTTLRAQVSDRMPAGVVYTTFHHPVTGANVVTTEYSDWATNCPEYKVTAVQVEVATEAARAEAERRGVPDEVDGRGATRAAMTGHRARREHGVPPVVRLGHDLVRNFEALPPDEAAVEIATHIRKFWEPRMRQELLARIRWGDTSLHPLLVRAAEDLLDGDVDRSEVREPSGG